MIILIKVIINDIIIIILIIIIIIMTLIIAVIVVKNNIVYIRHISNNLVHPASERESWVQFPLGAPDFFQYLFCYFSLRHIRASLSDDEPRNNNNVLRTTMSQLVLIYTATMKLDFYKAEVCL